MWGGDGPHDAVYLARFLEIINDDLNMPRALALVWDLAKSDLPRSTKKSTLIEFDKVLGLNLADWLPDEVDIPANILELVEQRQQARADRRWEEADDIRSKISAAGSEVQDTSDGPRVVRQS